MNAFVGFVKKEICHIFRDIRTLLILVGMPVVQILLFGYVVTNEIKDADIAVLDYSKDDVTKELTSKLTSSGYFVLKEVLHADSDIEKVLRSGSVKEVIVFESNFAEKMQRDGSACVQVITDASDANTANLTANYTQAIIADYMTDNAAAALPIQIKVETRMMYNETLKGAFMFVPGTMALILMLISAMMTSISIAREKEMGTMEILLVSPLKPVQIIIGKVMPYVGIAFLNATVLILMGVFVFKMPVHGSVVLLFAESLLFITVALALGIFISTLASTQQVAMFISLLGLILPTMLLSGFIFPIENMPKILQLLTHIFPPRYFIVIVKNIMLKGTGLFFVWKESLILLGFLVVLTVASIKKFKVRLA